MINNFIIVIPSYNRSELIKKKTLNFIINNKLNDNTIYIFTPQIEEYKNSIKNINNIYFVKCENGLNNARNYIMKYFDLGTKLLILDDDIDNIINLNNNDINSEIIKTFEIMQKENIKLGSINPTNNPYFSDKKIKTGYYFCIGAFYFLINDKYYLDIEDELEDYSRSILYFKKYGKVLRNNFLLLKTKYNQLGGMYDIERNSKRTQQAIKLFLQYPEFILLKKKKNYLGIQLRKNSKNVVICQYGKEDLRYSLEVDCARYPILGKYPNINKENIFKLDKNKNYIFKLDNKIIGYLIRNIYKLDNDITNIKLKNNDNSGDISGKLEINKIQKCSRKYFNEFTFNKNRTRTKKSDKHKFEISNSIKRISGKIKDNEIINKIYLDVKDYNILNECNYFTLNKDLQSAYHKDNRNNSNYVMLLNKNNTLDLHLPELNLLINNKDNDLLIFDLKKFIHANTQGNIKDRYSLIFFDKKIKENNNQQY